MHFFSVVLPRLCNMLMCIVTHQERGDVQGILFYSFLWGSPQEQSSLWETQVSRISPKPWTWHWKPSMFHVQTSLPSTLSPTSLRTLSVLRTANSVSLARSYISAFAVLSPSCFAVYLNHFILWGQNQTGLHFEAFPGASSVGISSTSETLEHLAFMTSQH